MKASFFEFVRYVTSQKMPAQWPLPPGLYEPDVGGQAFQSVLERLARYAEWRRRYEQASDYTRRQVELEPWLEASYRAAMRRLALGGQVAAALAAYEQLRRMLAAELGSEPEAETATLYEQLKAGTVPAPAAGLVSSACAEVIISPAAMAAMKVFIVAR